MSEKGPIGRMIDARREAKADSTREHDIPHARDMAEIEDVFRTSAKVDREKGIEIGTLAWKGALRGGISDVRAFEVDADGNGQSLTADQLFARADQKVEWGKEVAEHPEWWPGAQSEQVEKAGEVQEIRPEDADAA